MVALLAVALAPNYFALYASSAYRPYGWGLFLLSVAMLLGSIAAIYGCLKLLRGGRLWLGLFLGVCSTLILTSVGLLIFLLTPLIIELAMTLEVIMN